MNEAIQGHLLQVWRRLPQQRPRELEPQTESHCEGAHRSVDGRVLLSLSVLTAGQARVRGLTTTPVHLAWKDEFVSDVFREAAGTQANSHR